MIEKLTFQQTLRKDPHGRDVFYATCGSLQYVGYISHPKAGGQKGGGFICVEVDHEQMSSFLSGTYNLRTMFEDSIMSNDECFLGNTAVWELHRFRQRDIEEDGVRMPPSILLEVDP